MKRTRNDAVKAAVTSYLERRNYPVSIVCFCNCIKLFFTVDQQIITFVLNKNSIFKIITILCKATVYTDNGCSKQKESVRFKFILLCCRLLQ